MSKKVKVIIGPTASGKSELSIQFAGLKILYKNRFKKSSTTVKSGPLFGRF